MFRGQTIALVWIAACLVTAGAVTAAEAPPAPGPKDRCATCGMFVAKYPNWVAVIEYADGSRRYFDGPKDLFRFRAKGDGPAVEENEIWVTDYYTTRPVKAREAVFVRGSDVLGPMGAELVPLSSVEHAESFRADHGGGDPLGFDDIDAVVLQSLESDGPSG
jgi:nitrous oxide reductase accessory protein NosL